MCPHRRSVPLAMPRAFPFGNSRSSSRYAWTWPSPQPPSAATTAGVSRNTFSGAPGTSLPSRTNPTYCGTRMTPCESWPHRLASTSDRATVRASGSGTPAAANTRAAKSVSTSGRMVGTVGPRE